jgi:tRNA-splicing ligase RtcB
VNENLKLSDYEILKSADGAERIKMWTKGVPVEDSAKKQLLNVASMPFIHGWVAVMPDVHWGMGATVGSVIPTVGAVIPAAVGVDIGCGMLAAMTSLTANDLPDNLLGIRTAIEAAVPHGRSDNGKSNDVGSWRNDKIPLDQAAAWAEMSLGYDKILSKHPQASAKNTFNQLGTLGSGNHFIELCLDENNQVWIMLHSGSRGVGNRIGSYFIEVAKKDMGNLISNLPDSDLAYLSEGTAHFDDYIEAVSWAQSFAKINRDLMLEQVVAAIRKETKNRKFGIIDEVVSCHHNYISREFHYNKNIIVTRKGAVYAGHEAYGIIPGSMGAKSFIVKGKANAESFNSCSHGAGRKMSRNEAKKTFTLKMHRDATEGVECRKDKDVIDETPMAYKDIDAVMSAQSDLVDIVHTLKQVVCVKG